MKSQMKLADRSGARLAVIIGSTENSSGTVTIRDLRRATDGDRQLSVSLAEAAGAITELLVETI